MMPNITLTDAPTPEMRQAIADGLVAFNRNRTGASDDPRPLALLLSDPESDAVVGGLLGSTLSARPQPLLSGQAADRERAAVIRRSSAFGIGTHVLQIIIDEAGSS